MSTSDDTPPSGHRVPRPRPSGQTMVGLGAVESEPPTTPPRGLDLRGADTTLVLEQLSTLGGKVDALISDHRDLSASVRSLVASARTRDEALFALLGVPKDLERISARVEDVARRLGVVERAPREGSSPQLEALASLALEDAETEVRARKARAENRARAWAYAWKALAFVGPIVGAVLMRECG